MAVPEFVRLAAHPLRWQLLTALAGGDYRVRELVALVGEPQNLVSYHLRLLRDGGLVTTNRSSFDGRDTYYHLDLDRCATELAATGAALHPALRPAPQPAHSAPHAMPPSSAPPTAHPSAAVAGREVAVLFVCTGNSARSPIAEALLRHHTGGRAHAVSAGTQPRPELHPDTERVLREAFGIDVAGRRPQHVDAVAGHRFDHVITLCDKARESCPDFGSRRTHWSIPEPDGYTAFQQTAADIDTRVRHLLPTLEEVP